MGEKPEIPVHPGSYIREHVIPPGMTVTSAAKRLGVGRPALSNLLNRKSSLSPDMAVKMEKSFGVDRKKLRDLQAAFDLGKQGVKEKSITARRYVPPFLTIKAGQINDWASNIDARHKLPVLLRKLVRSTGHELRRVDFPGYDNAERKGWDGVVETDEATPWVPEGKSGWEFGTNREARRKAESDYTTRLRSVSASDRSDCTFVFVTPRNWPSKNEWAEGKNKTGDWKAVRAFDASDLEQWLEESIHAQMWLAEHLAIPVSGFETLDRCWQRWTDASEPKMGHKIFEPSISTFRETFKEWLEKPREKPLVIAADSKDEALAFLSCLFRHEDITPGRGDLAVVFNSAETLRTLADSSAPFIPIVHAEEVERELAGVYRRLHCIVVRPRNAVDSKPDIALELLSHETFKNALAAMGINGDRVERLARESGRSPTILRRRLSQIDAIRKPEWARKKKVARSLIPITLIGAWHTASKADCDVLETLAGKKPYERIEKGVADLLQFDDSPVWSTGQYRGVASKIDALFAVNKYVVEQDLTKFFQLAEDILSESDHALELPEDQRWAAGVYGKVRKHSAALREGICETLVILSVHGNILFKDRLGVDVAGRVSSLIRKLLTPLSDKLLSQREDLPHYAEAAPDEFLSIIEEDLRKPQPVVFDLLKPAENFLSSPMRTGLLWALECLAWKHLVRVSLILARLSKLPINDSWANRPIGSLSAVYLSWLPQTAASLEDRIQALQKVTKEFPGIGWELCTSQFETLPQIVSPSYRPHWRNDASDAGGPVTRKEYNEFKRKALDFALAWSRHDQKTLSDLVQRLPALSDEDQRTIWDLIDAWADSESDESAKALLCEQIRTSTFALGARRRGVTDEKKNRARRACEKLQPQNIVTKHAWLFAGEWIDLFTDDTRDENLDYPQDEERINQLRAAAMKEIWQEHGFEGVKSLLSRSAAPNAVGRSLESCIEDPQMQIDLLQKCFSVTGDMKKKFDGCVQGFLLSSADEGRAMILSAVAGGRDANQIVRLFCGAPFKQHTWRLLDDYGERVRDEYWREVQPHLGHLERYSEAEIIELIDRLLEAGRPRAAFAAVNIKCDQVETASLKRLIFALANVSNESEDHYRFEPWDISMALDALDGRPGVTVYEMAQIEFAFIDALKDSEHGIPNLEQAIAESPALFVQALALAATRRDKNAEQDPPEWRIENPERRTNLSRANWALLNRIGRIPGTGPGGEIDTDVLLGWIIEVRRLCAEHDRAVIGDQMIGQLLSKAPAENDGGWPCIPVCEAMEKIASREIGRGFAVGVYNSRGVHSRGMDEGGDQERELAAKYRGWAKLHAFDYPYVSRVLESIAAGYDRDAEREDNERLIEKRLGIHY